MKRKLKNKNKGSFTVEASIVFSTILFSIIVLLLSFFYMYQKVLLQSAATYAVEQGSLMWSDSSKNLENGKGDKLNEDPLYYNISSDDIFKIKNESKEKDIYLNGKKYKIFITGESDLVIKKLSKIAEGTVQKLKNGMINPKETILSVEYDNKIILRTINVTISQEINIPFGFVKGFFGGKNTINLSAKSKGTICEPTEYIRNIDLGIEYKQKLTDMLGKENTTDIKIVK